MIQLPLRYLKINKTIPPQGGFFSGKLVKGLISIGLATIFTTTAAFAAFSVQSANRGNILKAGTVILHADSDPQASGIQETPLFSLSDIKAGDSTTKQFFLHNGGTLGLNYNGTVAKTDGDDDLFNSLTLKVGTTNGGDELYNGTMSAFTGFIGGARNLSADAGENIYFTIFLESDAGEELFNKTLTVSFVFSATQAP